MINRNIILYLLNTHNEQIFRHTFEKWENTLHINAANKRCKIAF